MLKSFLKLKAFIKYFGQNFLSQVIFCKKFEYINLTVQFIATVIDILPCQVKQDWKPIKI